MTIVIIEDEKLTAKDLAKTLKGIEPDIEILAMLHSVEEALDFFKTKPNVDLIFSDIELGDGLSFDIFNQAKITTPIIFCTAYNQYALDAFKTTGIDYVLKPFSKQSIEKTLIKFQNLKEKISPPKEDYTDLLNLLKLKITPKTASVLIHQGDKIIPLNSKDIALFYIENDCTYAYTFDQKKHFVSQKLEALEMTFAVVFFRANRQFLVNRKAIKDVSHYFNRKMVANLTLPFSEQIIVGKLKTTEFMQWLADC
jgi:two-component system, LytTR family, response regulator LytT